MAKVKTTLFSKVCNCGAKFQATGPAGRYCKDCQLSRKKELRERNKLAMRKRRELETGIPFGRGSGAHNLRTEDRGNYKHGKYVSQTQTRKYRKKVRYCERCGIDTWDLGRWHWVTHHKDHNHSNHAEDNLELLCKSCHAKEHDVITNIMKVQRLSH